MLPVSTDCTSRPGRPAPSRRPLPSARMASAVSASVAPGSARPLSRTQAAELRCQTYHEPLEGGQLGVRVGHARRA